MFILLYANCVVLYCVSFYVVVGNKLYLILSYLILCLYHTQYKHRDELGRVHTCSGSRSGPVPVPFRSRSGPVPVPFRSRSGPVPVPFRSRSGPVPLVRVAFTPTKIDRIRSGCGPVTRSHLFRNATGTRTVIPPPPQHPNFGLQLNFGRCIII